MNANDILTIFSNSECEHALANMKEQTPFDDSSMKQMHELLIRISSSLQCYSNANEKVVGWAILLSRKHSLVTTNQRNGWLTHMK